MRLPYPRLQRGSSAGTEAAEWGGSVTFLRQGMRDRGQPVIGRATEES